MSRTANHDWSRLDAMTVDERRAAAVADADARPLTPEDVRRMKRTPQARVIRRALGLSQEEFATRFHIPLGTLRDWEQGRKEPDAAARAYLVVIGRNPSAVAKAFRSKRAPVSRFRPVTRRDVEMFTNYCVVLRAFWIHYQTLFEGDDLRRELLQNTARNFFGDLNQLFIEHLILQICKLTDPEVTAGRENLTMTFLVRNSDFSNRDGELTKLQNLLERIEKFRQYILPARNKIISHLDLEAAHRESSLGGAPINAWLQFWLDLQDFLTIMHARYIPGPVPFYLNGIAILSDADQLIKAIKESTYFHATLDDSTITSRISDIAIRSKYREA